MTDLKVLAEQISKLSVAELAKLTEILSADNNVEVTIEIGSPRPPQ